MEREKIVMGQKQLQRWHLMKMAEVRKITLKEAGERIGVSYRQAKRIGRAIRAVCSRRKLDWEMGLRWIKKKGAMIQTTEIIAFQLLKEAGTEEFRGFSKLLK